MNPMTKGETFEKLNEAVIRAGLIEGVHSIFGAKARMRLEFTRKVCDTNIDAIDLSVRAFNALKRNGVNTLGEAVDAINDGTLASFRNLGAKSLKEIKVKIINYGYDVLSDKKKQLFLMNIVEINTKG